MSWSGEDLIAAMGADLWREAGGRSGRPLAVYKAARDLLKLYEEANNARISAIIKKLVGAWSNEDDEMEVPTLLVRLALGTGPAAVRVTAQREGVAIPSFTIHREGIELVWEGGVDEPAEKNPGGAPAVLVLEDDPQIQRAMGRWVRKVMGGGIEIVTTDNVASAIAALATHDVTLIVSDVDVVGDQTGVDLFEYVRAHHPELVDRYIFFTGGHPEIAQLHYRYLAKGEATFDDFKRVIGAPAPPRANGCACGGAALRRNGDDDEPMTLRDFAEAITESLPYVMPETPPGGLAKGRFGDRKVFVAALWRMMSQGDGRFRALAGGRRGGAPPQAFKDLLYQAHRARLLTLARADLVAAMDPAEITASEVRIPPIGDMDASFHFVVDPTGGG